MPDENGRYTRQADAYCRVPAGQVERQGRLEFHKFPRLERMVTIFKSILRNLWKVRILRLDLMASYLSWKADQYSLATDAFQQPWKHRGLLYILPLF